MEWHQFLREERARKVKSIALLEAGTITFSQNTSGFHVDTSTHLAEELRGHVIEIDAILAAAGQPLEVEDRA